MLDQGRLSLDPERQRYDLHYLIRSSCDGRILSETGAIGTYTQLGSTLVFEIASKDRPTQFRGRADVRSITVEFHEARMVFSSRAADLVLPRSGFFAPPPQSGRQTRRTQLATVQFRCSTVDTAALMLAMDQPTRLIFAPVSGYFGLGRQIWDTCTGGVNLEVPEGGPYERIGRVIHFDAQVPQTGQTVRRFRGLIKSATEIDVLAEGAPPQRFAWAAEINAQREEPGPSAEPTQPVEPQDAPQLLVTGNATDCVRDTLVRVSGLPVMAYDAGKNRNLLQLLRALDPVGGEIPDARPDPSANYDRLIKLVDTASVIARDITRDGSFMFHVAPRDSILILGLGQREDQAVYYSYFMLSGRSTAIVDLDMSRGGCEYLKW